VIGIASKDMHQIAIPLRFMATGDARRWQNRKMSNYEAIQPILDEWAHAHGLHLFTQHQDEEVQSDTHRR